MAWAENVLKAVGRLTGYVNMGSSGDGACVLEGQIGFWFIYSYALPFVIFSDLWTFSLWISLSRSGPLTHPQPGEKGYVPGWLADPTSLASWME